MSRPAHDFEESLVNASAESAVAALVSAGPRSPQLIETWLAQGNAAAIAEAAERAEGAARKAARRALNVLKARGVTIPRTARVTALGSGQHAELTEAHLLAPDSAGNVLIALSCRAPAMRGKVVFVYLNDRHGVHRVDYAELSQSQFKEALSRALPGARYRAVSVPVEWARQRVAAARKRHVERGLPEPLGFARADALLSPVPAEPVLHPFDAEGLELSIDDAADLAQRSAALHQLAEFQGWFPNKPAVDEMFVEIGRALSDAGHDPGQEPPAEVMRQVLTDQIAAATDRYFSPERREVFVTLLKDSALSVLSRDGEERALEVSALIKVISEAGLITNPPREIPFLRGFFEKAVSLLALQNQGRIRIPVPPGQAAAALPSPPAEAETGPAV
jgi:hypothetical protein